MRRTTAAPAARMLMARPMGRGAFLRGVGAAAVAGAATFSGVRPVRAEETGVTYVYPSDSVSTIQQKLDVGGTIIFKQGTYTFQYSRVPYNPPTVSEFVKIRKNCTIKGETSGSQHLTKVVGGLMPFRVADDVAVTIENIWFDSSNFAGMLIPAGNVTVKGCKSTNCNPAELTPPGWYPGGFALGLCFITELPWLYAAAEPSLAESPAQYAPPGTLAEMFWYMGSQPQLTVKSLSSVTLENNTVNCLPVSIVNGYFVPSHSSGISGHDVVSAAAINVNNNKIYGAADCGIFLAGFGSCTLWVTGNTIESQLIGQWYVPAAIAMYDHFAGNGPGSLYICDNVIKVKGEGIYLAGASDSVIKGNSIECTQYDHPEAWPSAGLDFWECANMTVQANQFKGVTDYCICLFFNNNSAFIGNNTNATCTGYADWGLPPGSVLMIGDNNIYVGNNTTLLDFGMNNMISGMTKKLGKLSQEQENTIADAVQKKKFFTMKVEQ